MREVWGGVRKKNKDIKSVGVLVTLDRQVWKKGNQNKHLTDGEPFKSYHCQIV